MRRGGFYGLPTSVLFDMTRVSRKGTEAAEWDKNTWPELKELATKHPESGVHFQSMVYPSTYRLITLANVWQALRCTTARKMPKARRGHGSQNY